jgi:N-dimethylarginine dimethylaminohydrolase
LSLVALTRAISRSLSECELTHIDRAPIDLAVAREQHAVSEALLATLGCRVIQLPEAPKLPDAVFIERRDRHRGACRRRNNLVGRLTSKLAERVQIDGATGTNNK